MKRFISSSAIAWVHSKVLNIHIKIQDGIFLMADDIAIYEEIQFKLVNWFLSRILHGYEISHELKEIKISRYNM